MATSLADTVREALGDDTSDSAQRFAMETLSATSLDAVREYARGMEAMSASKFDDALQSFSKAVALDPKFGIAYGAMAATSRNLERQQDAEKYAKEAISHFDSMTERERFRTRGFYYSITNDYQACVKEYGDLIARYSADAAARNNRALCLTQLRNMPQAVEEMRQVVKILPNRALYRENLALYAAYSGDFQTAEQEILAHAEAGTLRACWRWRLRRWGRGRLAARMATYRGLPAVDDEGTPTCSLGLADLALYEGRSRKRRDCWPTGADADVAGEGSRQGGQQVCGVGRACGCCGRRRPRRSGRERAGARQQSGREDPVPGGAGVARGRRAGEGASVVERPCRRAAG